MLTLANMWFSENQSNTVQDGQKITQKNLGEHKVITPKQHFLGLILSFFYAFKMAIAIAFFCVNAVEAI